MINTKQDNNRTGYLWQCNECGSWQPTTYCALMRFKDGELVAMYCSSHCSAKARKRNERRFDVV